MVANTGTYLDTPAHRFRDGFDLAALALTSVANLPGVLVDAVVPGRRRRRGGRPRRRRPRRAHPHRMGRALGHAALRSTEHPFLTGAAAAHLAAAGAALVGIDSVNIDDTSAEAAGARPAHTALLAAGIPVLEHLCGLDQLAGRRFRLFAVPPKIGGMATFPVRAFAITDD